VYGKTIGLVHWIYHRSTWTPGDYTAGLVYHKGTFRGSGAGRKLIEHVYQRAWDRLLTDYWLTHENNSRAICSMNASPSARVCAVP
jgi:GNAT superfamily N-acetyltransferase